MRERKEVQEPEEAKERDARVAAFFDLDGTLLPKPSLEKRLFSMLRHRHLICMASYWLWMREALRLAPRGIKQIQHANKMYLRGVRVEKANCAAEISASCLRRDAAREAEKEQKCAGEHFPPFFPDAVERAAWHAERGHAMVILSGTLEPLAKKAGAALETELLQRGFAVSIAVCATRLEAAAGSWTGRVAGEAMFGEAKAGAAKRFCASREIQLSSCFAYADSANDRWMLEAVGKPIAVNPSNDLARIAARNGWPVVQWKDKRHAARQTQSSGRTKGAEMNCNDKEIAAEGTGNGI
ncbi:MAG TPA: HAD-IB family phosphatase [Candidatus Acidoferrum sp.]|nr:HAD-IB family phosphatase [Candidatus Acidoferrum sp.]